MMKLQGPYQSDMLYSEQTFDRSVGLDTSLQLRSRKLSFCKLSMMFYPK